MKRAVARLFQPSAYPGAISMARVKSASALSTSCRSIASIPWRRTASTCGSPERCHISHSAAAALAARTGSVPRSAERASDSFTRWRLERQRLGQAHPASALDDREERRARALVLVGAEVRFRPVEDVLVAPDGLHRLHEGVEREVLARLVEAD